MEAISLFSSSICLRPHRCLSTPLHSPSSSYLRRNSVACPSRPLRKKPALKRTIRAVAEEEILAPEAESTPALEQAPSSEDAVAVPVLPSDLLTMFFKAEGTMDDRAISKVTQALEGKDGVSDLRVQTLEGIANVELKRQTTVQATGVASNLVEIIQAAGFKLQTLSLSFEDEEDSIN